MWIDREDLLHQFFLLKDDGLAVNVFLAVRGHRTLVPPAIAGWMIADYDEDNIRLAGQNLGLGYIGAIGKGHLSALGGFPNALHNAYAKRRRAAIPVKQNLVCPWTNHRDSLEFRAIQRERVVVVLQQDDRLVRLL